MGPASGMGSAAPHTSPRGTQRLPLVPAVDVAGVHARSPEHSSPLGHAGAQNEPPPSCAHTALVQSVSPTHGGHGMSGVAESGALASSTTTGGGVVPPSF